MIDHSQHGRTRTIEILRGAWGAALLLAPRQTLESIHQIDVDHTSIVVARILGVRQIVQATSSGVRPSPEVLAMGVWVDLAHAATALGLAGFDQRRRPAGLVDAAVATIWAGLGWRDIDRGLSPAPAHQRWRDVMARWVLGHVPGGAPLRLRARLQRDHEDTP